MREGKPRHTKKRPLLIVDVYVVQDREDDADEAPNKASRSDQECQRVDGNEKEAVGRQSSFSSPLESAQMGVILVTRHQYVGPGRPARETVDKQRREDGRTSSTALLLVCPSSNVGNVHTYLYREYVGSTCPAQLFTTELCIRDDLLRRVVSLLPPNAVCCLLMKNYHTVQQEDFLIIEFNSRSCVGLFLSACVARPRDTKIHRS